MCTLKVNQEYNLKWNNQTLGQEDLTNLKFLRTEKDNEVVILVFEKDGQQIDLDSGFLNQNIKGGYSLQEVIKPEFILWASYNGLGVYTNSDRTFSFTENILEEILSIIKRGYPIQPDKGESFEIAKDVKLNNIQGNTTFKGLHTIYTNVTLR